MSAEATVDALIADQSARAQDALDAAIEYGDAAQTAAISIVSITPPAPVPEPSIEIPEPPENTNATAEFTNTYTQAFADFGGDFQTQWQTFIDTFFPDIDGCIRENSDNRICNTIVNGGTGIPAAVENAIWDRARSRELEAYSQAADAAVDEFAGRGFTMPNGILAARLQLEVKQYNDKVSTINRDIAIKNIEIEIENIRFAVEQAVKLRLGALQAAIDYVKAWFLVPQTAIDKARALAETHFRFYGALSSYYDAVVKSAGLVLEAQKFNANITLKSNEDFIALTTRNTQSRVDAAVGSAAALGRTAAAALGSVNTLANLGNITTQEA